MSLLPWRADDEACGCRPSFVEPAGTGIEDRIELRIDADDCSGDGDLANEPACRATAVDALADRDADTVRVRVSGYEHWHTDEAVGLLQATGRFAALAAHHDPEIAATARTDPLAAAREATGRAGPVGRLAAETGLAAGAERADRESARSPVTTPADTAAGRALNDSRPFVDALRLRIAVAARESVSELVREQGGIRATVDLPSVDGTAASLRRAKSGVEIAPVDDDDTAMRVTIRNLTVRTQEGARTVARRGRNVSLTVETPVLALHQRARAYERRLNRGALDGPGLARGLTTRLIAVTMARGYGRYAGAPIRNVLGNRHVELSTNAALLAQQRAAFGRHDPAGAQAVDVATLKVGVLDVLGGRHGDLATATKTLVNPNAVDGATTDPGSGEFDPDLLDAPPIDASPNAAADRAYLGSADDPPTAGSYRVRSSLRTAVLDRTSSAMPEPRLSNWTLVDECTTERPAVTTVELRRPGPRTRSSTQFGT